jgi:ABC-2 type transport system permease protein
MTFLTVVATEFLKLRRSRVTWISFIVYACMAAIAGAFLWMMMNPALAQSIGLLGQKAQFAFSGQSLDGPGFLVFIVEMGGIGGLIMCSIIAAHVFGREYVEGTAKNLLALPIPRVSFVLAKIIVVGAWYAALTLWLVCAAWLTGSMLGLDGLIVPLLASVAARLAALAGMSLCCSLLVAWLAVQTRGYFAPLGAAIGTVVLASVFGHTGWGPWVPWSIVALYSGAAGPVAAPGLGSLAVLAATFAAGAALTIRHEVLADNAQ